MHFVEQLSRAERVVFFTGAGASTEPPTSIPDFRSSRGLWRDRALMESLTRGRFFADPEGFWAFFREIFLPWTRARPNAVHAAPPRLAALGKQVAVVTQNIDGLDVRCAAGYPVYELHGHLRSSRCPECGESTPLERYPEQGAPRCGCGAVLKPEVVLFDDPIDYEGVFVPAREAIARADLLVIVGTSLTVAPACQLATERLGTLPTVIVNRDPTPYDRRASRVVHQAAGRFLSLALDVLEGKPGAEGEYRALVG